METVKIDLNKLVNPNVDWISGRTYGIAEAEKYQVLDHLIKRDHFVIMVDEKRVKAINDSFIKGFFNEVFEKLKTKENVKQFFDIEANDYFKRLFEKNWTILENIYSADCVN